MLQPLLTLLHIYGYFTNTHNYTSHNYYPNPNPVYQHYHPNPDPVYQHYHPNPNLYSNTTSLILTLYTNTLLHIYKYWTNTHTSEFHSYTWCTLLLFALPHTLAHYNLSLTQSVYRLYIANCLHIICTLSVSIETHQQPNSNSLCVLTDSMLINKSCVC